MASHAADPVASTPPASARIGRIPIRELAPVQPENRWAAKAAVGEVVPFTATIFREGHGLLGAEAELLSPEDHMSRHRMQETLPGTDRWVARVHMPTTGTWRWRVRAWGDDWATWLHEAGIKVPLGQDVDLVLAEGAALLAGRTAKTYAQLREILTDSTRPGSERLAAAREPRVARLIAGRPIAQLTSVSEWRELRVERRRSAVGSWYEFFPRSEGARQAEDGTWTSGTFRTAAKRLPAIAAMGFDVVYLPPIHPIGVQHRKGRNNSPAALPGDPGSPWAIGGPLGDGTMGGHDAIHPELGTVRDFAAFVRTARALGLEVALDLALQCSPDHPWVTEHPNWFRRRADGSIAYAENPPKKYEDIYPLDFDRDFDGLYAEVLRILEVWISRGVEIFRVDNPHTKPLHFWERLLHEVNERHPDVVFLSEAFTRPAMMKALAGVGFQQSYSYFTWRNTKQELEEFLTSISGPDADYLRPNLFVNTPDILSEYLQFGGTGAFKVRAAIAATAAPSWGVYSGFELFEAIARPGTEEYIDSEKYQFFPRDWARAASTGRTLAPYLTLLNDIRSSHPALGQLRGLSIHWSDDDAVLVYAKRLEAAFTGHGRDDTIIVVANTDPHSVRETLVHLDLDVLGLPDRDDTRFEVTDLVTGESWNWSRDNYVRLDAYDEPVHILSVGDVWPAMGTSTEDPSRKVHPRP